MKIEEKHWTARRVFVLLQKRGLIKLNYFGQHVMHFNFFLIILSYIFNKI
jgi:hypothetical protein